MVEEHEKEPATKGDWRQAQLSSEGARHMFLRRETTVAAPSFWQGQNVDTGGEGEQGCVQLVLAFPRRTLYLARRGDTRRLLALGTQDFVASPWVWQVGKQALLQGMPQALV